MGTASGASGKLRIAALKWVYREYAMKIGLKKHYLFRDFPTVFGVIYSEIFTPKFGGQISIYSEISELLKPGKRYARPTTG